ncbi:MAG: BamA/TamA family outer membrane protein [Bacteroidales bacterium]|nr:BamA/TamA family outer membrane protein [Bacteroidales bacterium]
MRKKSLILLSLMTLCIAAWAQDGKATRTGWTFGVLPSVAYDADLGLQYGALTNIYYFGDGSTYPEYLHSFYAEAAYTTMNYGLFRLSYDSKYLIKNHRLSVDLTYLPDKMCDFYGFNGYQTVYHPEWTDASNAAYKTRAYYKMQRDLFRLCADLQGTVQGYWKWNAGVGVLSYAVGPVDVEGLNKNKKPEKQLPDTTTLYEQYVKWGLVSQSEKNGGTHPYVHGGLTYDSRDRQQNPRHGIHADAFLHYTVAFGDMSEYNSLKFNATWRHYLPILPNRLTLAYRFGTQLEVAGHSPFYVNTYLNQLYMQRVLYEGLGGANSCRGIMRNRILADGFAYGNIELRMQLVHFKVGKENFYIGINPFMDGGMVVQERDMDMTYFGSTDELVPVDKIDMNADINALHLAAGCGLKVAMNDNFVLSVDWARALDARDNAKNSNLYIKMGYMF